MTRARCALAALLLGVLAVVAGASTANGAAPVPTVATGAATGGTSTAGTATVGAAPAGTAGAGTSAGAADVGAATAGTATVGTATASSATARAAVAGVPTAVGTTVPAPRPPGAGPHLSQGTERTTTTTTTTTAAPAQAVPGAVPYYVGASGELAVSEAGHEHPLAAADPAQTPRAGGGRAYLLSHAPPPPYDALPPSQPGPAGPGDGLRQVAAASFGAPRTRPGELPGVRGPPGRTTGSTTGHPSRSADPAPLPH
ncbi:hypothetical protein RI138_28695 [Streptomyces sp. C11-1]|uniref:Uncharacterized protein n=1 Tax=Streptomyces durocortorensis TaxID=2811104 RepID=A0ABY9WAU2_9ACTN|nr:hypothetical protein [Streptomyces durocortorensis]WNF30481.1 hypothetical protein RI138_28695 [Streptomyces durocortorensis]